MELLEAYRYGLNWFTGRVAQVGPDQWHNPTPCPDWDVRTLVGHVVSEDLWTVPMLARLTIAEVGDRYEGDLLGADPAEAARRAAATAEAAVIEPGALNRTVHLSAGDTPAREYVHQLLAEHLIHGWDLAVAIGADPWQDPTAVRECADWFTEQVEGYRTNGLVEDRGGPSDRANEQDRLLAAFGRDPAWRPPA